MSIAYVIATYSAPLKGRPPAEQPENILQYHLEELTKLLRRKRDTLIKHVIVVCPLTRHPPYPNYYQKEKWEKLFKLEFPHVQLHFFDYVGYNIDHSYDQWIQAYEYLPNQDYYLLIEDDYYIEDANVDVDLVRIYKEKFPNNIGYLASWVTNETHKLGKHAAISNGLISRETFEKLGQPLRKYYAINPRTLTDFYKKCANFFASEEVLIMANETPQLKFTRLFLNDGIPLDDIRNYYQIYFWDSSAKTIIDFSPTKTSNKPLFIPVQFKVIPDCIIAKKIEP